MSDIGDVQIQVNGQWVDMHEWLHTDATAEEVERITGKGKGTWVVPNVDFRQAAVDLGRGIVDGIEAGGALATEFGEAFIKLFGLPRSDE